MMDRLTPQTPWQSKKVSTKYPRGSNAWVKTFCKIKGKYGENRWGFSYLGSHGWSIVTRAIVLEKESLNMKVCSRFVISRFK